MDCDALVFDPMPSVAQQWFVLHTKSRQEKVVAQSLQAREVKCFLPLVEQIRLHGHRKVRVQMPLFPGYVFLYGSREDAYEVDRARRIAQIIEVTDQTQIEQEINVIRQVLISELPLDPYPYLAVGVRVRVRCGPLEGMCGLVESRSHMHRLVLGVEVLGQACSLEIDGAILEILD